MKIDRSISQLAAKLDSWFEASIPMFASADRTTQGRAIVRGVAIVKELDQLKTDGLAALKSLMANYAPIPEGKRVASLLRAFEFGAKLKAALHDELLDTDSGNKIVLLMNDIAAALDATAQGRSALGELLGHSDPRVRASAGAYLLIKNLMSERVVPILRAIDEKSEGSSAEFTAHWALLDWELKQKAAIVDNTK